jgi:hypothetical protein
MRKPSNNPITLPFGSTEDPYNAANPHRGTDFSYRPDDTIYAPFAGKVSQSPNNGNDGNGTYMTDPQGRFHGFLHASSYLVPNGSNVAEGQPIAVMGNTGLAIGRHLHWAVKENNKFIDPLSLIKENEVSTVGEEEFNYLFFNFFGDKVQPTDGDRKRWIGGETNTVIRQMQADPRQPDYDKYVKDLEKAVAGGVPSNDYKPYNGSQLYVKE